MNGLLVVALVVVAALALALVLNAKRGECTPCPACAEGGPSKLCTLCKGSRCVAHLYD